MFRNLILLLGLLALGACATVGDSSCPAGTQNLPGCPPLEAINDEFVNRIFEERTWLPPGELGFDPIEFGREADIPVQNAFAKILGPSEDDALDSLASKIWMVENAQHTVDAVYYIYVQDLVGYALLGALCDAVKRGVDVRIMVDSTGSMDTSHPELKALETCAEEAGFMRNAEGQLTTRRARVQAVVFNALSNLGNINRRSHDKLLVVDGEFDDKARVIAGGRNISLSYYGITAEGERDPDVYMDAEILLRQAPDEKATIGEVNSAYYSLLFLFDGNRRLKPTRTPHARDVYRKEQERAATHLAKLKAMPLFRQHYDNMPRFMNDGFHETRVLLAHELANLTDKNVVIDAVANTKRNANSIIALMEKVMEEATTRSRIVSPYIFAARYYDKDGEVLLDDAAVVHEYIAENPEATIEIITNSVVTSDNVGAQAVIDMDMAPRLLLTPEQQTLWLGPAKDGELNPALVESEAWQRQVNNPRVVIYQTGMLDSTVLGGDREYGKLHGKFIVEDAFGFVGTSNFDYRSRLFNNEMGYFVDGPGVLESLNADFEMLKALSYRWGSPEWLEMRRQAMQAKGMKGWSVSNQRTVFKTLKATGLDWFF